MLIEVDSLSVHFKLAGRRLLRAVDQVSFSIKENEVLGLVGESGSGKSTLGKAMIGLLEKNAGYVRYRGEKLPSRYSDADYRRHSSTMQLIFQDPYASLNPRMTAGEIVAEPLRIMTRLNKQQIAEEVTTWLHRVGLDANHLGRYPHEFSGGQRQRLGIARALITKPEFVICDEPISALDVSVQAQIINLLDELKHSLGLTLLFIAHDLSMVRQVSDRMAVMYLGRLIEEGPADDVYSKPLHPYTKLLVSANPVPDPTVEKARVHTFIEDEISSPINIGHGCRFAARCPIVSKQCYSEMPQIREINEKRRIACHQVN